MALFTKKPVTIEAVQWPHQVLDVRPPSWITAALDKSPDELGGVRRIGDGLHINTLEGVMTAGRGDWIIRGVEGEIYPCKDSVFQATYAPAKPAEHHKSYEGGGRGLTFGQAIEQLKAGAKVQRDGWNGKGMWLSLSGPLEGRAIEDTAFWSENNATYAAEQVDGCAWVLPCITMKTATGEILMGWLASQTDMLAEDWCVVA